MRCLILGGGGFIGSHLSEALLSAGDAIRIFDQKGMDRPVSIDGKGIEWFEGDFTNWEDVKKAVSGCDVAYHLVSTTVPKTSNDNPIYDIESNLIGTLHLLELARGGDLRKVIFVSSGGTVYGIPKDIPIKEDHPTDPICSYGIGKLAIEKYLYLYHVLYGLDYCVLRVSNLYGERQRITSTQGVIAMILRRTLHDEPIEIWGDGTVVRDYIYIHDVIAALLKARSHQGEHRLFNIGSGQGKSLNDVISGVEHLTSRPVNRQYVVGRRFDVPVNILDISKASEFLGWKPQISFLEGLTRTLEWMRNNRS